jgi:peptide/nickel transport system ATP-binding protein
MAELLRVNNLATHFRTEIGTVRAVDGVSYHIDENEIVGFVGESGCGKSVTQLSVMQLIGPPGKVVGGEVFFEGKDLLKLPENGPEIRRIRGGKIAMIFQEPMTSLNPVLTIGQQLTEMVRLHLGMNASQARTRVVELMDMVGIPGADSRIDDYPHQFSGGMRQRIMIAMGLSCNPRILIADEPTTALDVTIQAQVLEVMKDMVERLGASLVLVTHNLGVVARYAQRIYIMYGGRVVETGNCADIFAKPRHPYTVGLLRSVPRLDEEEGTRLIPIPGVMPIMFGEAAHCAFLPRCPYKIDRCYKEPWPGLTSCGDNHWAACYAHVERGPEEVRVKTGGECAPKVIGSTDDCKILDVQDLKMYFPVRRGVLQKKVADLKAIDGVSFDLMRGETLGLVGESGCGKTTIGRCILGLYHPTAGKISFAGEDMASLSERQLNAHRSQMAMIFQDPYSSLDPRQNAGSIVGEPRKVHGLVKDRAEQKDKIEELFRVVGLDPSMTDRMPHEFSGGQRQRLGIARALSCSPDLIVCDEPISALDVSIQAQIVNLLQDLQAESSDLSYLFIAHDLSVVKHISDRIAVMYLGRIVEICRSHELYDNPLHPYTQALLSAVPIADPVVEATRERIILKGEVPSPLNPPQGCTFHPRCRLATEECKQGIPPLREIGGGHQVACIMV